MPSKVRLLITGTENGALTGRAAMDWLQNHYVTQAGRRFLSLPTRTTPRWRWLRGLQAAYGTPNGCYVNFYRERRSLQLPASNYQTSLRALGIVRPVTRPESPHARIAPGYGIEGDHWTWDNAFQRQSVEDQRRLTAALYRGTQTIMLTTGTTRVRDWIYRQRPWAATQSNYSDTIVRINRQARFAPTTPSPRIGIWR